MSTDGVPEFVLRKHADSVNHISFSGEKLLSSCVDGSVILWGLKNRRPFLELIAHDASVVSSHFLGPSSQHIVTYSTICVFLLYSMSNCAVSPDLDEMAG